MLCIGINGHVLLETAFHDRCGHQAQSTNEDVGHLEKEVDSHVESSHNQPCIDIPISMGPTDDELLPGRLKYHSVVHTRCLELTPEDLSISITTPNLFYASIPHFTLLSKVVLQI